MRNRVINHSRMNGIQRHCFHRLPLLLAASMLLLGNPVTAAEDGPPAQATLLVGAASVDITPDGPVAVSGQFELRIARTVETPLTANVLVLESRQDEKPLDVAVMVSCDLLGIPDEVLRLVREEVRKRLPALEVNKVFLNGTHTHTAPVLTPGVYAIPTEGVMSVEAYRTFLAGKIAEGIEKAWQQRKPGSVTWGLSHAVVAYNRRATYADGSAVMYGRTDVPEFRGIEGYEDHDIGTMFFWDADGKLISIAVNVSCPSQIVESRSTINADFWHPVRETLRKKYGQDVCVLAWAGAGGDQSPRPIYRKAAEERMTRLRGLEPTEELARRITRAVDEAYEVVKNDRHANVPMIHQVDIVPAPMRQVTEAEYAEAKAAIEQLTKEIANDPKAADRLYRRMKWHEPTVERFEAQKVGPRSVHEVEVHVLRIGDAVICTNPFELFTDYGVQIKARSNAVQTFVIQLVGGGTYVPSERAVRGGGYSAVVQSGVLGPDAGQMLVDRTVEAINATFSLGK